MTPSDTLRFCNAKCLHQAFVCISLAKRTFYGIKLQLQSLPHQDREMRGVGYGFNTNMHVGRGRGRNSCIELHLNAENGAHKHKSAARSVVREYHRINRGGRADRERGICGRKLVENLEIVASLSVQTGRQAGSSPAAVVEALWALTGQSKVRHENQETGYIKFEEWPTSTHTHTHT